MKYIFVIICSLALLGLAQDITYNSSLVTIYPQTAITNIIGNYYFYPPNGIFNTSSQQSVTLPIGNCTLNGLSFNLDGELWCLAHDNKKGTYSINYLSNNTLEPTEGYSVNLPNNSANSLIASHHYYIIANSSIKYANGNYSANFLANTPFEFNKEEFACPGLEVNINLTQPYFPIFFTGEAYIYIIPSPDTHAEIVYQTCDNQVQIGPTEFLYQDLGIMGFNGSTVFMHTYLKDANDDNIYAIPFNVTSDGEFEYGSDMKGMSYFQINDTNFIMPEFSGKNNTDFYLYAIDENMTFVNVNEFHSGVPGNPIDVTVIPGTLNAMFTYTGGQFLLNLETLDMISAIGMLPPITIGGGMVVNITEAGVFYQSPSEGHPHFIPLFWNAMYQDPTDPQHIFLMNIPSSKYSQFNVCTIIEINPNYTQVNQSTFTNCPLATNSTYTIKDVIIDDKENYVVTYRDPLFNLYLASPSQSYGPFTTTSLFTFPMISINYTNGTGTYVGAQVVPPNFVIGNYNLETGVVYSKTLLNNAGALNYVYKLSEQYALLSATTTGSTTFSIYNIQTAALIYQFTSKVPMPLSTTTPYFALNVDPVNNPRTLIDGIVVVNNGNSLPYLVNTEGDFVQVSLSGSFNNLEVYPFGSDSIFLSYNSGVFAMGELVQITSWGVGDQETITMQNI